LLFVIWNFWFIQIRIHKKKGTVSITIPFFSIFSKYKQLQEEELSLFKKEIFVATLGLREDTVIRIFFKGECKPFVLNLFYE